uniref:Uncharacterized protein n=1 Tax=Musca domestica TaxID=7370 RepID=A0A1I8NK88_MUSDO
GVYDGLHLIPARNFQMKCYRACTLNACRAFNIDGTFAAHAPYTMAYGLTRLHAEHWATIRDVTKYCIKVLFSFPLAYKASNICENTEQLLQCIRLNVPSGTSFVGAF